MAQGGLLYSLSWWMTFNFLIGLPLREPVYSLRISLYTFTVLGIDLMAGVVYIVGMRMIDLRRNWHSTAYHIAGILLHAHVFLLTSVLHAVLVRKLGQIREMIQDFDQRIIVDLKLKKFLRTATILSIIVIILVHTSKAALLVSSNFTLVDLHPVLNGIFCVLWAITFLYSDVTTVTLTFLLATLAYQFSLIKSAMHEETAVPWDKLYARYAQLCKLTSKLQKCFNVPVAILVATTFTNSCISMFYLTEYLTKSVLPPSFYALLLSAVMYWIRSICLCNAAEYLSEQANAAVTELVDADLKYMRTPDTLNVIRGFSANISHLKDHTSISVGGFCRLGKPLLLTILAVTVTYFVLLRQVNSEESKPAFNLTGG